MADALASGASVLRDVGVQVPFAHITAVEEPQNAEVTNSKGVVTSSVLQGSVLRGLAAGAEPLLLDQVVVPVRARIFSRDLVGLFAKVTAEAERDAVVLVR